MGLLVPEQTLMSAKSGLKISHAGFLDLIGITAGLQLLILQQHFFLSPQQLQLPLPPPHS